MHNDVTNANMTQCLCQKDMPWSEFKAAARDPESNASEGKNSSTSGGSLVARGPVDTRSKSPTLSTLKDEITGLLAKRGYSKTA